MRDDTEEYYLSRVDLEAEDLLDEARDVIEELRQREAISAEDGDDSEPFRVD